MDGVLTFRDPTYGLEAILQENMVTTDSGVWFGVQGFEKKSIHVIISGTATAQIYVSNRPIAPAAAVDDVKYGADIAASGLAEIKIPVKWIKVKVSALTPGASVSAYLQGCP